MLRTLIACLVMIATAGLAQAQAPADSRMKRIADTKTIKLGYRAAATPFSFVNDKKEPVGYTVDLCKMAVEAIGKTLGGPLKIEWVEVTTQNRFDMVSQGKADMECGSSTITLSRMKDVDFSSIIFVESTGLVVKADAGFAKASDLDGKTIAVAANTSNERALADLVSPISSSRARSRRCSARSASAHCRNKLTFRSPRSSNREARSEPGRVRGVIF